MESLRVNLPFHLLLPPLRVFLHHPPINRGGQVKISQPTLLTNRLGGSIRVHHPLHGCPLALPSECFRSKLRPIASSTDMFKIHVSDRVCLSFASKTGACSRFPLPPPAGLIQQASGNIRGRYPRRGSPLAFPAHVGLTRRMRGGVRAHHPPTGCPLANPTVTGRRVLQRTPPRIALFFRSACIG